MGSSTIRITRAKNVSFMRLSLFYLIFIVQIFFTSPGLYVMQYKSVAATQTMINERLESELNVYRATDDNQSQLKNTTLELVTQLDKLKEKYYAFEKEAGISGDRLRENKFAELQVRQGALGVEVNKILSTYLEAYGKVGMKNLADDIKRLRDYKGVEFDAMYYFFKATPNGVVPTIFEHFKTVFLYQSLIALKKKDLELPKFEILTIDETDFIQKFKRSLILGETLDLKIRPKDTGKKPVVKINGNPIEIEVLNKIDFRIVYKPARVGDYSLEVSIEEKRLLASFEVVAPAFRFMRSSSSISGVVGEKFFITLDSVYVPKGDNVKFVSNAATVERKGMQLIVIPQKEGRFEISMLLGNQEADKASFFATSKDEQKVALMDVAGNTVSLSQANKLESENSFWQVVDFDMSVTYPDGTFKKQHSSTRFLRNELRELEIKAPKGSVIVCDNIRLVGQTGGTTAKGESLVIIK